MKQLCVGLISPPPDPVQSHPTLLLHKIWSGMLELLPDCGSVHAGPSQAKTSEGAMTWTRAEGQASVLHGSEARGMLATGH